MKKISGYIVAGGALLAAAGLAGAQAPARGAAAAASPGALVHGKVLVLDNERTLEGDIERVGTQYRVRRLAGETWVPLERVLCLCANLEDAYRYLRAQANLRDPDERLRLASWCRQHGLRDQALAEVEAAVQLRPEHAPSRRLLEHLRQAALLNKKPQTVSRGAAGPPPQVDLSDDALGLFVSRVQPILMNTCACCHLGGRGGAFKLTRAYGDGLGNRRAVHANLAAVLAQVNARAPQASALLVKAVSVHAAGMSQAPLRSRTAPAYRTLESWVRLTLAHNPHLLERAEAPLASAERPPATQWGEDLSPAAASTPPAPPPSSPAASPPAPAAAKPAAPDPVDPEAFNRLAHPERTGPAKPSGP
jgi:hypothetical protein